MKSHINSLLHRNISKAQLFGYAIANLIGMAIILLAIQFYIDASDAISPDDDSSDMLLSTDYMIVSKRVSGVSLTPGANEFSEAEITDLTSQPWAKKVGAFTSANFGVSATLGSIANGLSTQLFFEAIPNEFLDIAPSTWNWTPNSRTLPIIISKEHLALYNFGFAASRGYPQLSESTISNVPLDITISGPNGQLHMPARIVGFSSRLNTIAVPESFLNWANENYGNTDNTSQRPSRLIIETNSPGNPDIEQYLSAHSYELAGDKVNSSRAAYFLSLLTATVASIGGIITLLSFFILILSIHLLLQKNKEVLRSLMMLGYSPLNVSKVYFSLVGYINLAILIGAILLLMSVRHLWLTPLEQIGTINSTPTTTIIIGLIITALITAGNFTSISRTIRRNFPRP